jgi:hypothetical protein
LHCNTKPRFDMNMLTPTQRKTEVYSPR